MIIDKPIQSIKNQRRYFADEGSYSQSYGLCSKACHLPFSFFTGSRGELQRESDFMASVDSSWISWGVGVFLLKPLKWTLSNMLGDHKVPAEEVLVAVELLKVGAQE